MQSDDLFIRKIRRHSNRPHLTSLSFDAFRAPKTSAGEGPLVGHCGPPPRSPRHSYLMHRSNSDVTLSEGEQAPTPSSGPPLPSDPTRIPLNSSGLNSVAKSAVPPRARAHSHEEPRAGSPTARRFRDPLLLLGLSTNEVWETEGDGVPAGPGDGGGSHPVPSEVPAPVWGRHLAHYDVQSILFEPGEVAREVEKQGNVSTGASAASQPRLAGMVPPIEGEMGMDKDGPLVLSCPYFRVEAGGETEWGLGQHRQSLACFHYPNMAVSVLEEPRESYGQRTSRVSYAIEYADLGACYYRKHFFGKEHQNYFGMDDQLGAVAVSLRREEKEGSTGPQYNFRLIIRTSQLRTLRGSILEEVLPLAARHSSPRGVAPKKLLEHLIPELNLQCLRLASNSPKVPETLIKLDEQGLSFHRKVGVLYCLAGQGSEEEMYNNEEAGPAFQEFLQLLGDRVRLRGFDKYRAQLDTKTDSTGTHSLYTVYQDYEIMFHVSTMLPYTPNNRQQLLRKRHIGNDIVTIVFQEPGALPFTPRVIRSHFQHVFIVVRVHEPSKEHTTYSVAVSCTKDIPPFGPFIPAKNCFVKGPDFRDFLLAKVINAENAAERSGKFHAMATRTRQEYLRDLALNHATTSTLEASSSRLALIALASKKREKAKNTKGAEAHSAGALVWGVWARDGSKGPECKTPELRCLLGISAEFLVLIDAREKRVVFNCSCRDILAWTFSESCTLDLYYETGDYICMRVDEGQAADIKDIVHRLQLVTRGCETRELTLLRNGVGQLGFQMDPDGFVTEVERFTFAEKAGLQPGARLVRVCERALPSLNPGQTTELLRTAKKVTITVVPPDENGKPRRSFSELYQKSLKEKRRSEPPAGEAELTRPGSEAGFKPAALQLLHSLSMQDGPPHSLAEERTEFLRSHSDGEPLPSNPVPSQDVSVLPSPPPDLILAATPKVPPDQATDHPREPVANKKGPITVQEVKGSWSLPPGDRASSPLDPSETEKFLPRTLSLRNSITKILSEAGDSLEDEWESIANLASACNSILEALSREGQHVLETRESLSTAVQKGSSQQHPSEESQQALSLADKVLHLESTLKQLQDDLQREKAEKAALQAEVQSLQENTQRLKEASESAAAQLSQVTQMLGGPPTPPHCP
ncbi:signal-induced proliferation-associated protein 1 [Eublepharis macularius]|uniref:Signal-induced proliferation-associated protein 1 n=1 Tax=Eublepharis macularius TaxID=481883 RepID=A0AA97K6T4_EUBMA|nr:signal-induced proliferation-associated protein 1 [Eublepharis macularius]XP_054851011.1 signal-induced proliferation-associated protein 1 [Eublepharis macularius]